jgi:NAD-dependent dihydropyrimidine dehydrogenase PreA subunit
MAYVVSLPCTDVTDRSCVEVCPVDCIYMGERMAYIHPDKCVDCGACEQVCPTQAIFFEGDLPEVWAHYRLLNAEFFEVGGATEGDSVS